MRHRTGCDVGFSWKKDDPMFSEAWERVAAIQDPVETGTAIYQVRSTRLHTGWVDVSNTQFDEMANAEGYEGRVVYVVPG